VSADARATIDELLAVLAEERASIRTLDGAAAERAATAKEALARRLASFTMTDLAPHATVLMTLRGELRRNGVLLAHARSCLREAMNLASGPRLHARV
jgi:hypothetical protein